MHAQIVTMNIPFIEHHKCSSSPKRKKKIYHYIPTQWIPMVKQVQEAKPKNFSPSNKKQQNRMAIKILKMNPKLVYDVFRDFKAYQGTPAFNVLSRTALLSLSGCQKTVSAPLTGKVSSLSSIHLNCALQLVSDRKTCTLHGIGDRFV